MSSAEIRIQPFSPHLSTTFEEFKQIEKDRGLARRLQKVVIDEPSVEETVRILKGLRSRYSTSVSGTLTSFPSDRAGNVPDE